MKILQVMAGAAVGGAETAFVDMCIAMHEAGHDIVVVTRANSVRVPRLERAGIKVYTLPFGGRFDIYTRHALKGIIQKEKPHIVQTWMSRAAQKVPQWQASMGIERYLVVSRLGGYYSVKHFADTQYFVTITPDIKKYLEEEGVDSLRIRQINNFAETEEVGVPVDRKMLDAPEKATLLLALGRLHVSKAFDTLISAVAGVPDVYLCIAGEGPDRAELVALITRLGVSDRVKLLGWRNDRAALFAVSDICVFSSRYEPFGTVFVQAWANKTPLVSTLSDGPRQFVRHGEDGLLVPIDDVEAMSAAIRRVIDEPELRQKMVENGYQRYLNEFTKEKSVQSYVAFFEEIREREGLV